MKISTSVRSSLTPLRDPRGSLKTIRSSTPSTGSSVTSNRSPSASTTSRTSTSGAEAPAVMPSVRTPVEPGEIEVRAAADQPRLGALALGDLDQAQRIGAVRRADHQHRVAARRDRLHRRLAVGGRVADVLAARARGSTGKRRRRMATISAVSSTESVVWVRKARLSGSAGAIVSASAAVSIRVIRPSGTWPNVPITSGWPAWPTNRMWRPLLDQPLGLAVDLGDERAGGVEIVEAALLRLGRHRLGHAMGGEDHRRAVRHLVQLGHEDRALGLQAVDDELVVDDLVADIDRRAVALERELDDADRAVDAGAEAARRGDQQGEGGLGGHAGFTRARALLTDCSCLHETLDGA